MPNQRHPLTVRSIEQIFGIWKQNGGRYSHLSSLPLKLVLSYQNEFLLEWRVLYPRIYPAQTEQIPVLYSERAEDIAHRNHYYNRYQRKWCNGVLTTIRTTHNCCKRILENSKCSYTQQVQAKFESKQIGSASYRRFVIKFWIYVKHPCVLLKIARSHLILVSQGEVLRLDLWLKFNVIRQNPSLRLAEHNLSNITAREVSSLNKCFDRKKANGPDKNSLVVLKNINPE